MVTYKKFSWHEETNLYDKVMCRTAKDHVFTLTIVFGCLTFLFACFSFWEADVFVPYIKAHNVILRENGKEEIDHNAFVYHSLSALCVLLTFGLLFLSLSLDSPTKLVLFICIIWPILTLCLIGSFMYRIYAILDYTVSGEGIVLADIIRYPLYILAATCAIHNLASIYCIVLLICLVCKREEKTIYEDENPD